MTFSPSVNKLVTLGNWEFPMLIGKFPEGFEYEDMKGTYCQCRVKIFGIPYSYYMSFKWIDLQNRPSCVGPSVLGKVVTVYIYIYICTSRLQTASEVLREC